LRFFRGLKIPSPWVLLVLLALASVQRLAFAEAVEPQLLAQAITERRLEIQEFRRIAEEANRRGYRVFLSGGLAASYGDFVKHQLLFEQHREGIEPERIANRLTNVVFPEQDYDLVLSRIDGRPEAVQDLRDFKAWLDRKIPRTLNKMSKWDVIGMKTTDGKHMAVEGDPDFALQNNDSLSIGLIELTPPPNGQPVVSEVNHVAKAAGTEVFLKDLSSDSITFLQSPVHQQTVKAMAGNNPEILGVIRILIKAFQFNKDIPPEQLVQIKQIVENLDPKTITVKSYPFQWIRRRAKRLVTHAYDPDKALEATRKLGLTDKLFQIPGLPYDDFGLWFNKAPLAIGGKPSHRDGITVGQTAGSLGIRQVAHETSDINHRLISWRYDGLPRAFISRGNAKGEAASSGNGFYTALGTSARAFKKRSKGKVVVFDVKPGAREGRDFKLIYGGSGVLWYNGDYLKVHDDGVSYANHTSCIVTQLDWNLNQPLITRLISNKLIVAGTVGAGVYVVAHGAAYLVQWLEEEQASSAPIQKNSPFFNQQDNEQDNDRIHKINP
jgi:hypothetical protein